MQVSDKGLLYLQGLQQLNRLGLQGTAVTGAGMPVVGALSGLQFLALAQTSVDSQGACLWPPPRPALLLSLPCCLSLTIL